MTRVGNESVFQISRSSIRKYPPLTKEKELIVTRTICDQKKKILFYLARFPHFLTFLTHLERQLHAKKIHPHNVFHLNSNRNSSSPATRRFSEVMQFVDEIEVLRQDWSESVRTCRSKKGITAIGQMVNTYGDKINRLLDEINFTQDFLNNYIDKLPQEQSLEQMRLIMPRLPPRIERNILEHLLEARALHYQAVALLIQSNLRLVIKMARRYINTAISFNDILQEGNLGLIKAVDRFDHRRGTRFSTYASWWIKQSINRAIIYRSRIIRFPIHLSEKLKRMQREIDMLNQELGRELTWEEITQRLDYSEETFLLLLSSQQRTLSLDPIVDDKDGMLKLHEVLPDRSALHPIQEITMEQLKSEVCQLLETLSNREQTVIQLRYGINMERRFTLEEVGCKLGVTRERIRQIEVRALDKLKHPSRSERLQKFL